MKVVKLLIFPDWLVKTMTEHGLTFEDGRDLKKMGSILSTRDLNIYISLNTLHYHDMVEEAVCALPETQPGLELSDAEDFFLSSDKHIGSSYAELMNTLYDRDVHSRETLISMLTDGDKDNVRLYAEGVQGDTIYVSIVATDKPRSEAVHASLESLVSVLNDQSPIDMERTSLFDLYLQHAV